MADTTTQKKPLSGLIKFLAVLLVLSTLLLISYITVTVLVKKSIVQNLQPMITKLLETTDAERYEVVILAEPDSYNPPWALEFHVFLTGKYTHISQISKTDAQTLLLDNKKTFSTEYSYDWDKLDYSAYARTISDSVIGRIHPVFMTLTDGDTSYMLKKSSYSKANVTTGDALKRLSPPSVHPIIIVNGFVTAFLLLCFLAALHNRSKKLKSLEKERKEQLAIAKHNDRTFGLNCILADLEEEVDQELAAQDRKSGKKQGKLLLIVIAALAVAAALVIGLYLVPNSRYNEAVALREAGKDAEAYAIFSGLGFFKDSKDICNAYDYTDALVYAEEGDYGAAYYALSSISGYEPAKTKAEELLKDHPYLSVLSAKAGDTVTLGAYEQDNNTANGAEPIEWTVLKNENGILFAVSKCVLDAKPYNTLNSDNSTLLPWLRDGFHDKAFRDIADGFISKVGLLTREDMSAYTRYANTKPEWTAYAKAQGPENHSFSGYSWWLEGDYFHSSSRTLMDVVISSGGYSNYSSEITGTNGVRPAIIIDCSGKGTDYYAVKDTSADTSTAVDATTGYTPSNTGSSNKTGSTAGKTKCTRCNGTGKVVLHYDNSWNKKEGYRYGEKCGGCGGTGYK